MAGGHYGGLLGGHGHHHTIHHTPLKNRKRTVSADSGCDMATELSESSSSSTSILANPAILEETVRIWANRMDIVLREEVNRARQMSDASKQALYIADIDVRDKVLKCWRDQLFGIMDLTADLVQCVNNDIKESLLDSPLHTPMREEVDLESEADTAAADKYFKGENNYVENFDYCD